MKQITILNPSQLVIGDGTYLTFIDEFLKRKEKRLFIVADSSVVNQLDGEETETEQKYELGIEAERITREWKLEFELKQNFQRETFKNDDTTRIFTQVSREAEATIVKSLGDHWSAGLSSELTSSTFGNLELKAEGSPVVEYSVFPYSDYSKREITFRYGITAGYYNYHERTIYNKNSQYLGQQEFRANMEYTQPWGTFDLEIEGSAFLHDFSKNRLKTQIELDFRVYSGLSLFLRGSYAWINNQLSIPAGDITDAERLLDLREQFTSYNYDSSIGLKFIFGSIYNNVVNPRL